MKRILFIDDEREMACATIARTSQEGLDLLRSGTWDEVWLDHDLSGEDTTLPVVDWLSESAYFDRPVVPVVYVHSMNPIGADTIVRSLRRYGYQVVRTAPPLVE